MVVKIMNELFLYLYLGDISTRVKIISIFGIVISVGLIFFHLIASEEKILSDATITKLAKASIIAKRVAIVLFLLGALLPSKFFFYTLAGAKIGEITISSELGKKAIEALNIQLDEYIKGIKNEKK